MWAIANLRRNRVCTWRRWLKYVFQDDGLPLSFSKTKLGHLKLSLLFIFNVIGTRSRWLLFWIDECLRKFNTHWKEGWLLKFIINFCIMSTRTRQFFLLIILSYLLSHIKTRSTLKYRFYWVVTWSWNEILWFVSNMLSLAMTHWKGRSWWSCRKQIYAWGVTGWTW